MSRERRRAPRYQLVADAEIESPLSQEPIKARTSDVSLVGCFMNTKYALSPGTEIQLQIKYEGASFAASGEVARSEASMGFGVSFGDMKAAQQMLLRKWLELIS
jgi:hypothetical protein